MINVVNFFDNINRRQRDDNMAHGYLFIFLAVKNFLFVVWHEYLRESVLRLKAANIIGTMARRGKAPADSINSMRELLGRNGNAAEARLDSGRNTLAGLKLWTAPTTPSPDSPRQLGEAGSLAAACGARRIRTCDSKTHVPVRLPPKWYRLEGKRHSSLWLGPTLAAFLTTCPLWHPEPVEPPR